MGNGIINNIICITVTLVWDSLSFIGRITVQLRMCVAGSQVSFTAVEIYVAGIGHCSFPTRSVWSLSCTVEDRIQSSFFT